MAPSPLQQRRTHNMLLFQKLLNLRDGASPFTLVLDSLEQGSWPVVSEFARRAKISKSKTVFISYSTYRKKVPFETDIFISTAGKTLAKLRTEILAHVPVPTTNIPSTSSIPSRILIIIDTLHPLATSHPHQLLTFLSSLLTSPNISLLATYHTDIPLSPLASPYAPDQFKLLTYLATAILSLSSFSHVLARKRARDRSIQEPVTGLQEGREGIIVGMKNTKNDGGDSGVVVIMELRRRSGRGVVENFVLMGASKGDHGLTLGEFTLLDDHVLYSSVPAASTVPSQGEGGQDAETTFSLGLTEKQRRDRDNVVLPYFEAQKDGGVAGPGEGGRILYEMGAEDREDFDDEEDEI